MNAQFIKGLIIGLVVPALGYLFISSLFEILVSMNIMDETTMGIATRRMRTMTLIAMCFIIIPINYFRGRRHTDVIRGIGLSMLALAGYWIYYFKDSIFLG